MSRLIITITLFISLAYAQTSKIIWMNYTATGCITCHRIASVKMNDTLYIFGTFHYTDRMNPFLIAVDSSLNIKWYKAFSHNLDNLAIDKMVKINDSLIAISGGHTRGGSQCPNRNCTFFGIFNIKTQNFVWAKYRQTANGGWHLSATAIDFDGNNLVIGAQSAINNGGSWLLKVDLNGDILWQKIIDIGGAEYSVMDVVFDGTNYVYLIRNTSGENPTLVKFDLNGNLIWAKNYDFGAYDYAYKLLKDIDGYVVVGFRCTDSGNCSTLNNDNILIFKTNFNGNIIWSKLYSSSVAGWSSEDRAYDIALDYDGNYLISGFVRASSNSSYPIVLKVNRSNGNLIWSRIWNTPPPNTSSNEAKGVISIGQGKFYLLTFIGSGTDASGGFAIIREDTARVDSSCTSIITSPISVSSITPSVTNLNVNINNASYSLYNFSLIPYSPSINQTPTCEITPISNYEFYKSCSFEIRANRGYIDIKLRGRNNVIVYDIIGNVIYSEFFEGERRIRVKDGIYIIKVGNERVKMVVR